MAKKIVAPKAVKVPKTESAQFSENQLQNADNSSSSTIFKIGAFYVNPIKQLFHGEKGTRRTINKLFGFEIMDDQVTEFSIPHSEITNIFICLEKDLQGPIEVEVREHESGEEYRRPTGFQYEHVTSPRNIIFPRQENNLVADPFVLKCVGYERTVSARYETDKQMGSKKVRDLLTNEDGTAKLQVRNTYIFEEVTGREAQNLINALPTTKEEFEQYYASDPEGYKESIEPWLL